MTSLRSALADWQRAHNEAPEEKLYATDRAHALACGFPVVAALCDELERVSRAQGHLSPSEVSMLLRRVLSVAVGEASERARLILDDPSHDGVPGLPTIPGHLAERERSS